MDIDNTELSDARKHVETLPVEEERLLPDDRTQSSRLRSSSSHFCHILVLYAVNAICVVTIVTLSIRLDYELHGGPRTELYSPANGAIEYVREQKFRAALFNATPYMGFPTDETDKLWSDLYNFGISRISKKEASQLPYPTLPVPGTQDYLIELDVWHELHCLNDLRKVLYPERFEGLDQLKFDNGTINRDTDAFRHWDHCVDSIRQTLMCHADVSPISFHINVPASSGIFPRLATTHTCRNFTKIQDWAKAHAATDWNPLLNPAEAEALERASGFDQSPLEDIEFLYPKFPGNPFFKHWQGQ